MSWAGPEDIFLSTSLASYLDKKLLVLLRDGRKLIGVLRSFDQFANAVLENALERVVVGNLYCDLPLGLYVIRGENVVLIGELDPDREEIPAHMMQVSATEIKQVKDVESGLNINCPSSFLLFLFIYPFKCLQAQKEERDATDLKGSMRKRMEFLDLE